MEEEPDFRSRKSSFDKRLGVPVFVCAPLGGLIGLMTGAANDSGGMLSSLSYWLYGGLGLMVGCLVGLAFGVFLSAAGPRAG